MFQIAFQRKEGEENIISSLKVSVAMAMFI